MRSAHFFLLASGQSVPLMIVGLPYCTGKTCVVDWARNPPLAELSVAQPLRQMLVKVCPCSWCTHNERATLKKSFLFTYLKFL